MSSFLLTNGQQTYVNSLFDIPFNLWKRPIKIITEGNTVVVSTNVNFNYNYKEKNPQVVKTITEGVYDAVVDYSPKVTDQTLFQNADIKALEAQGIVRISVGAEASALIEKAKDIQFDGHSYEVKTSSIPRGMFAEFSYYDFWLIRKN